jgi:hypothetical protein
MPANPPDHITSISIYGGYAISTFQRPANSTQTASGPTINGFYGYEAKEFNKKNSLVMKKRGGSIFYCHPAGFTLHYKQSL